MNPYICLMKIEVLFEDAYIMVVNKPNNVLIHNSYYARNIKDATLLELLSDQFSEQYHPIHRLDRKTSGVLMLAKQKEYVAVFQELFNNKHIEKKYYGVVRGFVNEKRTIDSPVKNPDTKIYKDARTEMIPIHKTLLDIPVHPYESARYSFVELIPATGRMHQLRIHMNKISHPIVGDYKYGDRFHNRMFEQEFDCHKLFLHAHTLQFVHPVTSESIYIKASIPEDWKIIFNKFDWELPA